MRRVLVAALALLAITVNLGWLNPALSAGEGAISGQVVNKTAGGSPVGGLEVTPTAQSDGEPVPGQQKATADSAGNFEFRGLPIDSAAAYTVAATFQDADYVSARVTLTSESPAQTVGLDVYDSTTSDENITISNGHIIIFAAQGALDVMEIWRFSNAGDKTFIGTRGDPASGTLQFTLPAGAASVSPGDGLSLETTATGLVSTTSVPPGVTDIHFAYFLPYTGSDMTLSRKMDYPVADFHLLVEDTGVKVTSTALAPAAPQNINGTNYLDLRASNVSKGAVLDASFSGIVSHSGSPEASFPWPWLLGGAVILGLVIAVAYPLKKKQALSGSPAGQATPESLPDAADELLSELARLDDACEAGTIDDGEYQALRAQAKASLMKIYARNR